MSARKEVPPIPTERFHNLSPEKQQRIEQAAMEEFADAGLEGATVASLIRRAGIPRGSFYQYFDGLEELWTFITGILRQQKRDTLGHILLQAGQIPFIDLFRQSLFEGLKMAEDNPLVTRIGGHMWRSRHPLIQQQMQETLQQSTAFYTNLITLDQKKGLIGDHVDPALLAEWLSGQTMELVQTKYYDAGLTVSEVMHIVDERLNIIRYGVASRTKEG